MASSLHRRRVLAAAVPGLLAGCLVESSEDAGGDETETSESDAKNEAGDDGGREPLSEDKKSAGAKQADDEDPPAEVGPDGSGLVVTNVDVLSVTNGGYETTVEARLTVENAGRFTYGTVEFRVDAYATRPNSIEREAVGYGYVTERFSSDDRFAGGARRFDASITFRSRETRARPDPDWYEVDAAVRYVEPV
jgi:hypothetical protein